MNTAKTLKMVETALRHGWYIEERTARGYYMARMGSDRRLYVAYLAA